MLDDPKKTTSLVGLPDRAKRPGTHAHRLHVVGAGKHLHDFPALGTSLLAHMRGGIIRGQEKVTEPCLGPQAEDPLRCGNRLVEPGVHEERVCSNAMSASTESGFN